MRLVATSAPAGPQPASYRSALAFGPCHCRQTPGFPCTTCARWRKHFYDVMARLRAKAQPARAVRSITWGAR
jgi:hypothetical protein